VTGKPGATAKTSARATAQRLHQLRAAFDAHLAALDARAAGVWGGAEYASAKSRASEALGAEEAGAASIAVERLTEAQALLSTVERKAPQALAAQLAAGEHALAAGDPAAARQAFGAAHRIDPRDRRSADGLRRVRSLEGALPLLADALNAETRGEYARAAQDYSQALALDPGNARARAGLTRANAAFGADNYAKAVGSGYAALGAGRLDEARAAFTEARTSRPTGREAAQGLERVAAAQRSRDFAATRSRAAASEQQERWGDALREYDAALKVDPSLSFALQGRARAAARAELAQRLQALIDDPQRLAAPAVHREALELIEQAHDQVPSGPVLRSQATRLAILLPDFDKPVHLAVESDNATQVAIPQIGSFGTFSRRDIELKPGRYTVIGTRAGYRDVRRDVTIAPGQDVQTISVRCIEPI
jgi:tetratricopeptide (TPR) repeat protein